MRIALLISFSLSLLASCTTQDVCDDNNQSILVARFKTIESDVVSDTIVSGVTVYGIREGKIEGKIEIAKNMLLKGYNIEDIANITDISIDEIRNIHIIT